MRQLDPPLDLAHARRFSVAPMMDWTDRHCRYLHRLLAPWALLYTEMVTSGAILFGDAERFLAFDPAERPLALQLGGAEPNELARAVAIAEAWPYDEINLNVGCPSDRVQDGRFGACLMAEPGRVRECVVAMREATAKPVTVKCRIGIDDSDPEVFLDRFVDTVALGGCEVFIVHARKAWLAGLSPKENREIPPLDYARVRRLKVRRPELAIILNGGLTDPGVAAAESRHFDGVMIGREAYKNPMALAGFTRALQQADHPVPERRGVIQAMRGYAEAAEARGTPVRAVARHLLGLYNGEPGARAWRRHLSEAMHKAGACPHILAPLEPEPSKQPGPRSAEAGPAAAGRNRGETTAADVAGLTEA